ncbi:hypothetical protein CVT25_002276, partial [Psilocybe cyanescens]
MSASGQSSSSAISSLKPQNHSGKRESAIPEASRHSAFVMRKSPILGNWSLSNASDDALRTERRGSRR